VIKENIELKTIISKQSAEIKFLQSKVGFFFASIFLVLYIKFIQNIARRQA
jgi:hypothetical protein